ncbi:MAG TPA: M1 family aminopeptidase [Terriglobales bacterium]|nr:M1 family aminopeptidase [Terriglobales bacterium]
MHLVPARSGSRVLLCLVALFSLLAVAPASAAEKPRLQVDHYDIDAELIPAKHQLVAHVQVKFTALEDLSVAVFELHNDLRPTRVVDANGNTLSVERVTQDSTIRIALPNGLTKGSSTTLTIDYAGTLESGDDSPVQGLKLAYVGPETSYLLYPGRWFPVSGYGTNRFTATMHITVPVFMTVIGSGASTVASGAPTVEEPAKKTAPARRRRGERERLPAPVGKSEPAASGPVHTFTLVWDKPSFPGTIIAGQFGDSVYTAGGLKVHVYFQPVHKNIAPQYGETAAKEFQYFSSLYGQPPSTNLKVVEIPDDAGVPTAWAAEIAALSAGNIGNKVNYRLLADTIAHQWWGVSVSPATMNDWWLNDGFARYSEARYVEEAAGEAAFQDFMKDISVGALAYDTVPLASVGKMDPFSPEFQSLTTDKGAEILNMLRWVMGDDKFDNTMRGFAIQFAGKSASVNDFQNIAQQHYGQQLTWFFTQWLNSTGAPDFKNKYTVYRLGNGKGFRIVGEITQDLDLFRMPVELKVETDGKTEDKRIEVVGTDSPYTVDTYGRPRRIVIDPNDWVLKNASDIKVRTAILRGQGLVKQGDLAQALTEFQKALEFNKNSSLAHYRIAEVFFLQHNYQAAANEYREAEAGDLDPKWTEVWSHIQLGKIFDLTGQRERATNEYRQALQTNDNTQGALEEARKYLQAPYQQKPSSGQ